MQTIDLIKQCKLYKDLIDPELDLFKLPLTGLTEKTDKVEVKDLFLKNYKSVIHVEIEKDPKDHYYGVVLFEDELEYFHAMQTMFFNLKGQLLMAISVLDEYSQKDGIIRVLRLKAENVEDSRYHYRNHTELLNAGKQGTSKHGFHSQGPGFTSQGGNTR